MNLNFRQEVIGRMVDMFPRGNFDELDSMIDSFLHDKVKKAGRVHCRIYMSKDTGHAVVSVSGPRDVVRGLFPGWSDPLHTRCVMVTKSIFEPRNFVEVKASRTKLLKSGDTTIQTKVTLRVSWRQLFDRPSKLVLAISDGGVTGYESVFCDGDFISATSTHGWIACAGTQMVWDRLFIPADQMRLAFDHFRKTRGDLWVERHEDDYWILSDDRGPMGEFEIDVAPNRKVIDLTKGLT